MLKEYYAILSGICAASGSIFGKFAGSSYLDDSLLARIVFFCLMIIFNSFVWLLLVKALQKAQSSLTIITISTATNYLVTAVCGYLVFSELTFLLWIVGTILIISGLILVISDQNGFDNELLKVQ